MNNNEDEYLEQFEIYQNIVINKTPVSQNEMHGWIFLNRKKFGGKNPFLILYEKYKKEWHVEIKKAIKGIELEKYRHTLIKITVHYPKYFDEFNLCSGLKPVPDILKTEGIIIDDSPYYFKAIPRHILSKEKFTTIDFYEYDKELIDNYFKKHKDKNRKNSKKEKIIEKCKRVNCRGELKIITLLGAQAKNCIKCNRAELI